MGFQAIAIQMGVAWGLGMLNRAMAGRPPRPPKPRPDGSEFQLTKAGTPIPIVYGNVRVDNPVLAWAGLFTSVLQPASQVYRYGASALFVLGVPPNRDLPSAGFWSVPRCGSVFINDTKVTFPNGIVLLHGNNVAVNFSLGGEGSGGRFSGFVEFFDGRADQLITNYPSTTPLKLIDKAFNHGDSGVDRSLVPGYRNQILLALLCDTKSVSSEVSFGESSSFPSIAATIGTVDADSPNGSDANIAWVIYDLVVARVHKLGYDASLVDTSSFQSCATTLLTEGNGCSVLLDAEEDADQVINNLCEQADGVVDEDPNTGLIQMRLVRVVDPGTLRELNKDNTIGQPRITQTGWLDNANHLDVAFTNRDKSFKPDVISSKRLSNAVNQNYRHRPRTVNYPYCMTAALAAKLAARDAALLCRPLMTANAVLDRQFYDLRRGQAVKGNWPDIGVTNKVFRVLDIDRGQLADDAIRVTLIEDVFDNAAGAITPEDPGVVAGIDTLPILNRVTDEAPLWLTRAAFTAGLIGDTTTPRMLGAGRREDEQPAAVYYGMQSRLSGTTDYFSDVAAQEFPTTAKVATAYGYHLEPYDTGAGLVIEDVTGELADLFENDISSLSETPTQIAAGANLFRIGGEMLAFESATSLGGGQYRLNNVWRALHDTVPADHAVGAIVYFLDYTNVGTRAWARGQAIDAQHIPVPLEPGFDLPIDELTMTGDVISGEVGRAERALRAADFCVNALEYVTGTPGSPGFAVNLKKITLAEGSLDAVWRQRNEATLTTIRGDDATAYSVQDGALWRFYARKGELAAQLIQGPLSISSVSTTALMLGKIGHGEIDVLLRTDGSFGDSWQDARCRVSAHRARNLLGNAIAQYVALAPWTNQTGTTTIAQGTDSLERQSSGRYFTASTASAGLTVLEQVVDVTGYKANGLRARVVWYTRNFSADADDHSAVQLIAGATDSTSSNVVGLTNGWKRAEHSITIPAGATSVTVRIRMTGVTNAVSLAAVAHPQLYVEQASDELLANGSFETGTFTGWTTVLGAWAADTTTEYATTGSTLRSARPSGGTGAGFAIAEMKQEIAIPTGREYGTAELRFARATGSLTGTGPSHGEVIVEVLNGGGSVIASTTTGEESPTTWTRRILRVDTIDGAATLRVRVRGYADFLSEAEGGTYGNGAARFDDFSLRLHKHLDASYERDLDFSVPQRQIAPTTWQDAYLAWPTVAIPIVWDGASLLPSVRPSQLDANATAVWSDGGFHSGAKLVGHWSVDNAAALSINAYRFERNGACIDVSGYGGFAHTEPFTIGIPFRVTERNMTADCGLFGNRDGTGRGYGVDIAASAGGGAIRAVIQGASGTHTLQLAGDCRDGAPHWAWLSWDPATTTATLYTEIAARAINSGAIGSISTTTPFRIGRDGTNGVAGGVDIGRVYMFKAALTADQIRSIMTLGEDPNGLLTSDTDSFWTSSHPVWVDGEADSAGATLVRAAARHVPVTYRAELDAAGDGYGVSVGAAHTNLIVSTDYPAGVNCGPEANVTLTQNVLDPTGMLRGVRATNGVDGFGYRLTSVPVGVSAGSLRLVCWARVPSGTASLTVRLLDTSDVSQDSEVLALTTSWQRFSIALTWPGGSPTAHLKFAIEGTTGAFDLASVVWAGMSDPPTAYQDANVAIGDRHGTVSESLPYQLHHEGEIEIDAMVTSALHGSYIASVDNNTTDQKNQRALNISSGNATATVWNDSGVPSSIGTAATWSSPVRSACRWNRLGLPESGAQQIGIRINDATEDGDSPASFTVSATVQSQKIRVGGGSPNASTSPHAALRRVTVRAREEKLP